MWSMASGSTGNEASIARSASAMAPVRSSPRCVRSRARTVVGNLVCTTDRSSAKSTTTRAAAMEAAGAPASAVITTSDAGSRLPISRRTSVVVPLRVMATTRSYRRPSGNSEAANASVTPCPDASRRTA